MLQNAYFLAKIGADTAENEQHFAEILPKIGNYLTDEQGVSALHWYARRGDLAAVRTVRFGVRVSKIGKISNILQIFGGLALGCIKTKFCKKICV